MNDKKCPLQPVSSAEATPPFLRLSDVVEVRGLALQTRAAKAGFRQFLTQVSRSAECSTARRRCSVVPGSPRPSRAWRPHVNAKEIRRFLTRFPCGSTPRVCSSSASEVSRTQAADRIQLRATLISSDKPIGDEHGLQRLVGPSTAPRRGRHLIRQRTGSPRTSTKVSSDETSRRPIAVDPANPLKDHARLEHQGDV